MFLGLLHRTVNVDLHYNDAVHELRRRNLPGNGTMEAIDDKRL